MKHQISVLIALLLVVSSLDFVRASWLWGWSSSEDVDAIVNGAQIDEPTSSRMPENSHSALQRVEKAHKVPYSVEQVYSMIVDVERFPEFVPFFSSCEIVPSDEVDVTKSEQEWLQSHPEGPLIFAQTSIGFNVLSETYLSRIKCIPNESIEAYSLDTRIFKTMGSLWEFSPTEDGRCEIRFSAEFEFNSPLYSRVSGYFLDYVSNKNVKAFLRRLDELYS